MIMIFEESQQEVALLSYLALPIRLADLLFNMCAIKGQDNDSSRKQLSGRKRERE